MLICLVTLCCSRRTIRRVANYVRQQVNTGSSSDESMRSSGFGRAFLDSITHRWGELELQDVEAATDWLRKQPWVDRKRVFASGGSYGGYMVAWMNGHVKAGRYQAYVCHAGCFDRPAMFASDAWSWSSKELG